jgi:hypothetical protein
VLGLGLLVGASGACGRGSAAVPPPGDSPLPDRPPGSTSPPAPGDASTSSPGPDADVPFVDFDVNHILVTGQSNSTANDGVPVVSTTQPFTNVMFDTGVMSMKGGFTNPEDHTSAPIPGCDEDGCTSYETPTKLVPLVEGDQYFDYTVETSASSLANEISQLATTQHGMKKHDVLVSIHGRSGTTYWCLRKGNCDYKPNYLNSFEQGMKEVTSASTIAAAAGKSYVVRAVVAIHGESDQDAYTTNQAEFPLAGSDGTPDAVPDYSAALLEWQRDYESGVKAITHQTLAVPLFVSQISRWLDVATTPAPAASRVAQLQLDAHTKAPGKVILIGPTYPLPVNTSDCIHFTSDAERRLGEYFAKVYAQVVLGGEPWEPVRPKSITLAGNVIKVVFFVPKPPLVFDTTQVAAAASQGFTYADDSGTPPAIANVEIVGADTVQITLAAPPTGGNKRLLYAMNQPPGACSGTLPIARGNVRDSDDTPSRSGFPLQNWAVHFDLPVQ